MRTLRGLGRANIPLLVISMLLALTLWIVVQAQTMQIESRDIIVPVTTEYLDPRYVVVNVPPTITVTIQGPADKLNDPGLKTAQAIVDLRDAEPGRRAYKAVVRSLDPEANRLLPMDTAKVPIEIEQKVTRSFQVEVQTKGRLADRTLTYSGAQVDPPYVEYSGSQSALASISKVRALLDLDDVDPDHPDKSFPCPVDARDSAGRSLPSKVVPSVAEVSVRPTIDPATVNKDLFIIANVFGRPATGFQVTGYEAIPQKLSVTGRSETLAKASTLPTRPIDVTGLSSTVTLPARLEMPQGLTLVKREAVVVRVIISRQQLPTVTPPAPKKPADTGFPDRVPPINPTQGGSH